MSSTHLATKFLFTYFIDRKKEGASERAVGIGGDGDWDEREAAVDTEMENREKQEVNRKIRTIS